MTESGDVDVAAPNIARMYDYLLGGSANFAVDREAAERFNEQVPGNSDWAYAHARSNRAFLGRAVRYLAGEHGIDQFLDLGSGVPTKGNVHEIARLLNPRAKVAYVDHEPVAVAHARRMLGNTEQVTVTQADARDPEAVLAAPGVAGLLDFTRPVAVLAVAILEVIGDVDPVELIAAYRAPCVPGSALVASHMAQLSISDEQVEAFREMMRDTPTPHARFTTKAEMNRIGSGYTWVEPGVVPLALWRSDVAVSAAEAAAANSYGAVGLI